MARALEYGGQALEYARAKCDSNFESIAATTVARAHRLRGNLAAAQPLLEQVPAM